MVGQAPTSLVSGDRTVRRTTVWWLGVLNVGFLLGSGAVMLLAWLLGSALGTRSMTEQMQLSLLLTAVVLFLIFDIPAARRGGSSRLGLRRQTPKSLHLRLRRSDTTALLWGADIGSGISTFRMTSAIWLGIVAVFLGVVPFYVGWLYGVGTALVISALVTFTGGGEGLTSNLQRLFAARRPVQLTYVGCVLLVGAAATAALLA